MAGDGAESVITTYLLAKNPLLKDYTIYFIHRKRKPDTFLKEDPSKRRITRVGFIFRFFFDSLKSRVTERHILYYLKNNLFHIKQTINNEPANEDTKKLEDIFKIKHSSDNSSEP